MEQSSALALDTHANIRELVAAGMPENQAETLVNQQVRLLEHNLATKADLRDANAGLRNEIRDTRIALEKQIADTRTSLERQIGDVRAEVQAAKVDLIKWMVTINIALGALIVAALKLLP